MKLRFGLVAGVFLAIFCLYPQVNLQVLRGDAFNGHYAYNDIDEVAYASYLRALIDGRSRRNDPYSGRDEGPSEPQPESIFSIQFAAPYTIAIPARLFGVGTPMAMTIAGAAAGFLTALAGFWLLFRLTGNNWFAMAGSIAIFAGGALAAGEGALPEILFDGFSYPYFPGFRRYIPALAMAGIFAMFCFVWKLLARSEDGGTRRPWLDGTLATACFAYCVYSYFYIWTTAAAFLAVLTAAILLIRPEGWKILAARLLTLSAVCGLTLLPYAYLLSRRADTVDHVQLLVHTRMPDLYRVPEYIGVVSLLLIAAAAAFRVFRLRDMGVIALAIVPLVLFNQQVITGRSLQPIHYQVFIGNYVAAAALAVSLGLIVRDVFRSRPAICRSASATLAVTAIVWGFVECYYTVRVLDDANIARDAALPVARRLEQLDASDPARFRKTVLSFDGIFADDMPSVAPQNVLWARHQHIFAGLSWEENKERYYQFLYYSDVTPERLEYLLRNDFVSMIALFGWGRHSDRLSVAASPLTDIEIAQEVIRFGQYLEDFDRERAASPLISYVVMYVGRAGSYDNLERWYELTEGEVIGEHVLYRARLK
jgi:hypothetical protein